jgi:hypothetical protein
MTNVINTAQYQISCLAVLELLHTDRDMEKVIGVFL